MGYTQKVLSGERVELDEGYYAVVRPLTKGEDDECQRALVGGEIEGPLYDPSALRARFNQRAYTDKQLAFGIQTWNMDSDDGSPWPIDEEHVAMLADPHATKLLGVIRGLTRPLAEPAKKV